MRKGYSIVKCPRCESTAEIVIHGELPDIFSCPVCLDGEIKRTTEQPKPHKATVESRSLVTV